MCGSVARAKRKERPGRALSVEIPTTELGGAGWLGLSMVKKKLPYVMPIDVAPKYKMLVYYLWLLLTNLFISSPQYVMK